MLLFLIIYIMNTSTTKWLKVAQMILQAVVAALTALGVNSLQ
jgi:hypothetical protein